ncbi:DNA cytosine methyltransferase, partial [Limnohabitans sp.]|uniref:DNA cytosine methyltransferase n=1 Tax=Limnohabitans sp. TaxID=1907725 RepID=UPI003A4E1EAA
MQIADHRLGCYPQTQQTVRTAVGPYNPWSQGPRLGQRHGADRSAAHLALRARHPDQLPASALVGWDRRLPFNANCINPTSLHSFPEGIDLIIAGPPCQPYSDAGRHRGTKDPRSKALIQVARLIQHLDCTQPAGIGY